MGKRSLIIATVNSRSIVADTRLLDLEILTTVNDIDVLCVTETWLSAGCVKHGSARINLPGFQAPFQCDCPDGRRGGGEAVYVRVGLCATQITLPGTLEAVCVRLSLCHRRVVDIFAVYRPPNFDMSTFIDRLDSEILSVHCSSGRSICIAGDFNGRNSVWFSGQQTDAAGRLLEDFALANDLSQVVSGPTHVVDGILSSQLDLIFVNKPSLVAGCCVLPPVSDHCPTVLKLRLSHALEPPQAKFFLGF